MKGLRSLRHFLGIEVAYSPKGYFLSYFKYIVDILDPACLTDTKIVDNPLKVNVRYFSFGGALPLDPIFYCAIVGSLVYLTITRLNIIYIVYIISQFVTFPIIIH